jgi:hypothetical protein
MLPLRAQVLGTWNEGQHDYALDDSQPGRRITGFRRQILAGAAPCKLMVISNVDIGNADKAHALIALSSIETSIP